MPSSPASTTALPPHHNSCAYPSRRSRSLRLDVIFFLSLSVQKGLAYKALELFSQQAGTPVLTIATILNIPDRTVARRKARRRFAPDESERPLRISRIYEQAADLFAGDVSSAVVWLRTKRKAPANQAPLNYSATELGAREVKNLIGQLEYSIFPRV